MSISALSKRPTKRVDRVPLADRSWNRLLTRKDVTAPRGACRLPRRYAREERVEHRQGSNEGPILTMQEGLESMGEPGHRMDGEKARDLETGILNLRRRLSVAQHYHWV